MTEPSIFHAGLCRSVIVKIEPADGYGGGWNGLGASGSWSNQLHLPSMRFRPTIFGWILRNVTNLGAEQLVPGEPVERAGFLHDHHDNQQDDVHRAASDSSPYVIFDFGGTCNLSTTRIWNLNQAGPP